MPSRVPQILCVLSSLLVSYSLRSYGLQSARLLCPWDSPDRNTRVGSHFLLQGIFPTQGSNPHLLHCRGILYRLSHLIRFFSTEIHALFMWANVAVLNIFGTRDWFCRRQFFDGLWFWDDSMHYIYCVLYLYYYTSSTSDHQPLDPRGWGPLN